MDKLLSLSTIRQRQAALQREAEDVRRRLHEINSEMLELETAESLVTRLGTDVPEGFRTDQKPVELTGMKNLVVIDSKTHQSPLRRLNLVGGAGKTIKACIIAAMRESPEVWTNANEVQERASALKGQEIPMATVSPYLSALKATGQIERDGMKIALVERLKEIEPPDGKPEDGSKTALDGA